MSETTEAQKFRDVEGDVIEVGAYARGNIYVEIIALLGYEDNHGMVVLDKPTALALAAELARLAGGEGEAVKLLRRWVEATDPFAPIEYSKFQSLLDDTRALLEGGERDNG